MKERSARHDTVIIDTRRFRSTGTDEGTVDVAASLAHEILLVVDAMTAGAVNVAQAFRTCGTDRIISPNSTAMPWWRCHSCASHRSPDQVFRRR